MRGNRRREPKVPSAPPKDGRRARSRLDDVDDTASQRSLDNSSSLHSSAAASSDEGSDSHHGDASELATLVEQLGEKRAQTKLAAIAELTKMLRSEVLGEALMGHFETLSLHLSSVIKRGAPNEVSAASELLSLALCSIQQRESLFEELYPTYVAVIEDDKKPEATRAAAAQGLAMLFFVHGSVDRVNETLSVFVNAYRRTRLEEDGSGAELIEEALRAWALVASTLHISKLGPVMMRERLPDFARLLDSDSLEVRQAAGENIAMVYAANLETLTSPAPRPVAAPAEAVEEMSLDDAKDHRKASIASTATVSTMQTWEAKRGPVDITRLVAKLEDLSTDSSKRHAKKDRRAQRSTFRDILKTMENGELPSEILVVGTEKREFVGWRVLCQLDAFRKVIGSGMQTHFSHNELLAHVFHIEVPKEALTAAEKKANRQEAMQQSRLKAKDDAEKFSQRRKAKRHVDVDE